ncbi:NHL repeat-containing protein, partial [bacterium]|nr:NHL repeat-containing protein [bacterium]
MRNQRYFIILLLSVFLSLTPFLSVNQKTKAQDENPLKIEKVIGLSTIPGTFRNPSGIAIAKDGTIFIADFGESQIEVFDSNLKYLRSFGSIGSGEGQFQYLQQIRIDDNDNLYVLDSFLCRIQVFSKEGKFIRKWGEKGTKTNQLHAPNDFVFLNQNEILLADSNFDFGKEKNNLKVFSIDGKFIRNFFKSSKYISNELYYSDLEVDHKGNIYIQSFDIDSLDNGFLKFSQDGSFLCDYISEGKEEKDITSYLYCTAAIGKYFYLNDGNALKKYEILDNPSDPLKFIKTILEETDEVMDETTIIDPS